jgi:integrase
MSTIIKNAQPGEILWDREQKGSVTGLHLKVTRTGKRVWMLYYRTRAAQQRRPKIGEFPQVSLIDARKRAKELLDQVAIGLDPKAQWDQAKEELTVDELFQKCWEAYWSKERFQLSGWAKEAKRNYENHIRKTFGRLRLCEVGAVKVKDWHEKLAKTPFAANRSLEILSRLFNYAIERELRPQNSNPCKLVQAYPEKERKRYASEEEIREIARRLVQNFNENPSESGFLLLLLYTGARPRSIERALRSALKRGNFNGMVYGVLEAKGKTSERTGDDETLVFPPKALEIIDQIPEPKDGTLCGCKMPASLWRKVRKEVGCPDLWARDLRRTFATVGLSHGVDPGVIGELQNHKTAQTAKIYQKLLPDVKVNAVNEIANRLEAIIKE